MQMKLSDLAEKPGYLSLMLDKAARANQGRPIVKGKFHWSFSFQTVVFYYQALML